MIQIGNRTNGFKSLAIPKGTAPLSSMIGTMEIKKQTKYSKIQTLLLILFFSQIYVSIAEIVIVFNT